MVIDVLPDAVREVIESHFTLNDCVRLYIRVSLRQKLDKTNEEGVCTLLSYCI